DPVAMRRLRRGLRRSGIGGGVPSAEVLRSLVLADEEPSGTGLTAVELAPVTPGRDARGAVLTARRDGGRTEDGPGAGGGALRSLVLADEEPSDTGLTAVELAPVTRVRHARDAVLTALRDGGTTEEVLWAAWSASRLERRLVRQAVAADPWARSADRSLDAVVSLFGHAADYVDRVPGGSVALFCDMVSGEDLPAPRRADTRARGG